MNNIMDNIVVFIIIQTLIIATPMMITAVGACVCELTGVTNIGLEGIMLSGAFAAAVTNISLASVVGPYIGLLVGMFVGGIISLIHAYVSIHLKGNQIVSGVAINLFAAGTTAFLIKTIYKTAGNTPQAAHLGNQYVVTILIYVVAILAYFVLYKTVIGLRIRAVGEHPLAADTVGINVYKVRYLGVLISGIFGGLGGAYLTTVMLPGFNNNMTAGRGFMALAAMIFGKWNPKGAIFASLLFAFGQVVADQMKASGVGVPQQFLTMIPYILTLLALIGFVGKAKAPKASGIPYEK